ncbi:hypothetical protein ACIRQY_35420 [Streptomyces sp. NPDC101490]
MDLFLADDGGGQEQVLITGRGDRTMGGERTEAMMPLLVLTNLGINR